MAEEAPLSKKAKVDSEAPWIFLMGWFCPYAQRAWIALNHHRVGYEKIEALPFKQEAGQTLKDVTGYKKHPLLLKHHPSGLVPTLVDRSESQPAVYDSLICVQFADDLAAAGQAPGGPLLLPTDPVQRARARMWADWVDKNMCSPFYSCLVPKDLQQRREGLEKLKAGYQKFQQNVSGPFFFGEHISIVDIAAFPWVYRVISCGILEFYRGPDFSIRKEEFGGLFRWLEACLSLESVQSTLADRAALTDTYKRYSDGTAETKVADAVRAGAAAHEHK